MGAAAGSSHGFCLIAAMLLRFMQVTQYLGYSSLKDFFPTMDIKPNTHCTNILCRQRQAEWAVGAPAREATAAAAAAEAAAAEATAGPLHETNEWGIEVVSDAGIEEVGSTSGSSLAATPAAAAQQGGQALPEGLHFSMPAGGGVDAAALAAEAVEQTEAGVDDLMAQLEQLSAAK